MEKIVINLNIDEDNNIIIKNSKTKKSITIEYISKILNAQDVYDVLHFEKGNNYDIKSDIDKINDDKIKEYYTDIITLFKNITDELNELDESDENKDNNVV